MVPSRIKQYCILFRGVNLNDCMTRGRIRHSNEACIHAIASQKIENKLTILSYLPGMVYLKTRLCQSSGLVSSLSSCISYHPRRR